MNRYLRNYVCGIVLLTTCVLTSLSFSQLPGNHWQTFQPVGEEFSIDVPTDLKQEGSDPKFSRNYRGEISGIYLYIFSDPIKKPYFSTIVTNFLDSWGQTFKLDAESEKPVRLKFRDPYGYWQQVILIRSRSRIYIAQVVSKDEDDSVAKRFASSFRLSLSLPEPPAEVEAKPELSQAGAKPSSTPASGGAGRGGGLGVGQGSGRGSGSGIGTGPVAPPQPGQTKPLKIVSKPRPGYTDIARFYQVSGTVTLRVTFLASGQIGTVSVIRSLPFGLTNQAIAAAKRLQFEPLVKDGTPMSVTKGLEYTFLLY